MLAIPRRSPHPCPLSRKNGRGGSRSRNASSSLYRLISSSPAHSYEPDSSLSPLAHSYESDSSFPPLARSYGRGVGGEGLPLSREPSNSKHVGHLQGFTLVELLAVIVIIAILSSLVIQALSSARQDALAAKTRATIAKIDSVLNEKMDEYLSKPLKFMIDDTNSSHQRVEAFPKFGQSVRDTLLAENTERLLRQVRPHGWTSE